MSNFDRRNFDGNQGEPVFRVEVPQLTVASGSSAAVESSALNLNGRIKTITVKVNDNTNNVTAQVQIIDDADTSIIYFDESAIAENATTRFRHLTESGTDIPMNIPIAGGFTVKVTPSADPGVSTLLVDVALFGD